MANKEYQMLFKLSAQAGREFGTTFASAQQQMNQLQKEINQLNQTQADISAYQKQQTAVENTKRKLEDLQKQFDNIQREYQETGESSSDLANKMIDKQRAIDQTNQKLERETQKLDEMESELREAGIDTDNLADEQEKLGQQIDAAAEEMEEAREDAENYGHSGAEAFEAVGSALVAAGIADGLKKIAEAYQECVELSMDFQETMSTVEALSGSTSEEMAALNASAKELGATTKFTASEAGAAMTYMGMAGWDAQQMLEGMPGVLSLAAASGEDLATVSDIVTDNLTAFGMAADQTARFSDVLAAAATGSNTSVSVMGETFKKAAPVAGALGYSIEDVAVATGLMANAGVKGSRAGTALSNTFTGLLEGVTLTGEAIGEVEFSALNADGTMKSFRKTIESLRGHFDQLTEAEKTQNAMAIAGKQGYAGLLAVLNATDDDYNKLTDSINNCSGAAEKMAEIKMNNLAGQMTLLNSATDALKTTIGEAYQNEFQGLAKVATDIVTGINDFLTKHPVLLKSLIAITAEAGAFLAVYTAYQTYKKLSIALEPVLIALKKKEAAATALANAQLLLNPYVAVAAAVVALTVALVALVNAQKSEEQEALTLTAKSRDQYERLKELNAEYDTAVETYGENSEQAAYLRMQVEDLNAEYEAGKQTISEYAEELNSMADELGGYAESYQNAIHEIDQQETSSLALVHRLEELAGQVNRTAAEEDEMAAIIDKLNEKFPKLNLSIEQLAGNQPNFMSTVESLVKQEAAAERNKAAIDTMVDAYGKIAAAQEELEGPAKENLEAAQQAKDIANATYLSMYGNMNGLGALLGWLTPEYRTLKKAEDDLEEMETAYGNTEQKLKEAQAAYDSAKDSLENYYDSQQAATEGERAMNEALSYTRTELEELTAAYTAAYDAALDSVSGQFKLWDEAKEPVTVATSTIIDALESQTQYWNDYHANLDKLQAQTSNVEGLSEVIASFADGSSESVAAIAGMASASEEDLRTMVAKYKEVQDAQGEVSDSLADLTTDFTNKMDELQKNLEDDVAKMDLSKESAVAAKATIDAFAAEAENSYQRIYDAYASVRQAAVNALNGGSKVSAPSGASGYAEGTESATRGMHLVGEEGPELIYFEGGERVIPADETAAMMQQMRTVEAVQAESAQGGERVIPADAIPEESSAGGDMNVSLTIHVDGGGSAEEQIQSAGEALRAQLEEMLEDYMSDRARRVYR